MFYVQCQPIERNKMLGLLSLLDPHWLFCVVSFFSLGQTHLSFKFFHLFLHYLTSLLVVLEIFLEEFTVIYESLYWCYDSYSSCWGDDCYSLTEKFQNSGEKVVGIVGSCVDPSCSYISMKVQLIAQCFRGDRGDSVATVQISCWSINVQKLITSPTKCRLSSPHKNHLQ